MLKGNLKYFIEPHPSFAGSEEKIFTPRKDYTIKFWIEGGLEIVGTNGSLEINLNDKALLVLAIREDPKQRIIRVPWNRLIAFELIFDDKLGVNSTKLIYLKPEQKN